MPMPGMIVPRQDPKNHLQRYELNRKFERNCDRTEASGVYRDILTRNTIPIGISNVVVQQELAHAASLERERKRNRQAGKIYNELLLDFQNKEEEVVAKEPSTEFQDVGWNGAVKLNDALARAWRKYQSKDEERERQESLMRKQLAIAAAQASQMTESAIQLGDHAVRSLTRSKQRSERSGKSNSGAHRKRSSNRQAEAAAQGWWAEAKPKSEGNSKAWRQSCTFDFTGGIHRRSNTNLKPSASDTSAYGGHGKLNYAEKRPQSAVPSMMGNGARIFQNDVLRKSGPPPWQWPRSLGPLHGALPPGLPAGIEKGERLKSGRDDRNGREGMPVDGPKRSARPQSGVDGMMRPGGRRTPGTEEDHAFGGWRLRPRKAAAAIPDGAAESEEEEVGRGSPAARINLARFSPLGSLASSPRGWNRQYHMRRSDITSRRQRRLGLWGAETLEASRVGLDQSN